MFILPISNNLSKIVRKVYTNNSEKKKKEKDEDDELMALKKRRKNASRIIVVTSPRSLFASYLLTGRELFARVIKVF